MIRMLWISCVLAVAGFASGVCFASGADEPRVAPLTQDEQQAMDGVKQSEVLSTVAFLASDEMAGRNTPSRELDIAAAYVAARFQGAGLDGLGPDSSYYQITNLTQYLIAPGLAEISVAGNPIPSRGILFGGEKAVSLTAEVTNDQQPDDVSGKVVVIDEIPLPPQAIENPNMMLVTWARRIGPIAAKGAAVVLVRTADTSSLPEMAQRLKEKPLNLPAQLLVACPVILIPADAMLEGEVAVTAPARETIATPVKNVMGVLRGQDPELSQEAVIISAHLDHIGQLPEDRQGDLINNGADDNATGVTAVLALADAFARLEDRPQRSVIFMTFWGEEKGLLGSKYYADNPSWPLEKTVANINIEMIGRPEVNAEGKTWGTGWTRSNLGQLMAIGAARADVEVFHREDVSEMLYTRSDNYSLAQKGVIAHSFSAGSLHGDYHQPGDEVSKLNLPHMTRIIRGLFAGALPIVDGQLTPTKTAK
jgi:hypothetical protein